MDRERLTNSEVNRFGIYGFMSMFGIMIPMMYLTIFMTEHLGMGAALMGTILLAARIIDFFIGLSAGGVIERTKMKSGKYRSWFKLLRWAVLIGITMQFFNTTALPLAAQVVIVFIGYLLLHGSMDFLAPSQFGVLSMMAGPNFADRNRLSFRNAQFSAIGQIVVAAAALPAVNFFTPLVGGTYAFSIVATTAAVLFFIAATLIVRVSEPYDKGQPKDAPGMPVVTLGDMVKSVLTNGQLLVLLLGQSLFQTAGQVAMGIMTFYFMFVLGNLTLMALALTITGLFGFVGSVIGPKVGTKLGKKYAMVAGMLTYGVMSFGIAFFAANSFIIYIVLQCANTIGMYFFMSFGNLYFLDCGEYGYWKTGKDNRAVALAMGNMPIKIGMALGGALGAYGLALIGYVPGMAPSPEFATKFMYLFGGLPGGLALASGLIILFAYKLRDVDCELYARENEDRVRAAMAASGE
ncbi:MFS transporter [Alkalibacter rhizosphaerae]|uniref:MFS transporter n=1 Tax=Alkalibacter rhizosphaerae TaxID=2815577 RepID=A0A974XG26_9FIRM|nr:MFS transporter [Alkalibacter rhizosphaerae]QSX07638.1 MFS transporter [Alkalibacter rhizosphaerae]